MPTQLNFETILPAVAVTKVYAYIDIPVFEYTDVTWDGASKAVIQFNYEASKNFIIRELPAIPTDVNFVPVISWRDGMETVRYKLWSDVGEVINEPQYVSQVIKKNFKIEIWNIETSTTISSDEIISLLLSIKSVPEDWTNIVNVEDAASTLVADLTHQDSNVIAIPITGLAAWYKTGSGYDSTLTLVGGDVSQWADSSGNARHLTQSVALDRPDVVSELGFNRPIFSAGKYLAKVGGLGGIIPTAVYLVGKFTLGVVSGKMFNLGTNFGRMRIDAGGDFVEVSDAAGVFTPFVGSPTQTTLQVAHWRGKDSDEESYGKFDNFYADSSDGVNFGNLNADAATNIVIGDDGALISAAMTIYELLIYTGDITDEQHIEILQYLAGQYGSSDGINLPLNFDSNVPATDNP